MITIYQTTSNGRKAYINKAANTDELRTWLVRNIAWTEDASEIDQQLKHGNKIDDRTLLAIAENKGITLAVTITPTQYLEIAKSL